MKRHTAVISSICLALLALASLVSSLAVASPAKPLYKIDQAKQILSRFDYDGRLIEERNLTTQVVTRYLAATGATYAPIPNNRHMESVSNPSDLPQFGIWQVDTWAGPGTFHGGPSINVVVGKINPKSVGDQFCFTGLATGSLYCGNSDGSQADGFPNNSDNYGAAYVTMPELDGITATVEVFGAYWGAAYDPGMLVGYTGQGQVISGWPQIADNYIATPWSAANVSGDLKDELFGEEEDWKLHGLQANGQPLPGWPVAQYLGGQERHTPLIGDVNGDGKLDVVSGSGCSCPEIYALGYNSNGQTLTNYPIKFSNGGVDTFPVGWQDGQYFKMAIGTRINGYPWDSVVNVVTAASGTIAFTATAPSNPYSSDAILADLDHDNKPEILMQSENCLNVWNSDMTIQWQECWSTDRWISNAYPVVGDVNGDGWQEIIILSPHYSVYQPGWMMIFDRFGNQLYKVDLPYLGSAGAPYVGDIDNDGTNEVLIKYDYWDGHSGYNPTVGAFRFPQVPNSDKLACLTPEWSQFGHDAKHTGIWTPSSCAKPEPVYSLSASPTDITYTVHPGDIVTHTFWYTNTGTGSGMVEMGWGGVPLSWLIEFHSEQSSFNFGPGSVTTDTLVFHVPDITGTHIMTNARWFENHLESAILVTATFIINTPNKVYIPLVLR